MACRAVCPARECPCRAARGSSRGWARRWRRKGRREWKPRVGKEEGPRFRGADYEICRWRYFLNVKKVTKERQGVFRYAKKIDFGFHNKFGFFVAFAPRPPRRATAKEERFSAAPLAARMTGRAVSPAGLKCDLPATVGCKGHGKIFRSCSGPGRGASRDGNGKIAVRGGEAMAAKRTTAQGGFA